MPTRMIDGEALWRSDKLARVQPPAYRGEYANLIPLALADGTFECNARRVWADVYSYNRPDISLEVVEKILDEFERVGLLKRTECEKGKIWGFWTGIESRLPSESTRERYKQGKSSIFSNVDKVATTSRQNREDIVPRLVLDKIELDKIVTDFDFKNLARRFRAKFKFKIGKRDKELQDYRQACIAYGEDWVLTRFNEWADDNQWVQDKKAKFPLAAFYEDLEEIKESEKLVPPKEDLKAAQKLAEDNDEVARKQTDELWEKEKAAEEETRNLAANAF